MTAEPPNSKLVAGKWLVLAAFAIGLALAGGSWWYNFQHSRLTAQFWGARDAALLVGSNRLELLELARPDAVPAEGGRQMLAGRVVASQFNLSDMPGLVHLRHALTYDGNFLWSALDGNANQDQGWTRALRFREGDRELIVLFHDDFRRMGRIGESGHIEALPCFELGNAMVKYLAKVGAPGYAAVER